MTRCTVIRTALVAAFVTLPAALPAREAPAAPPLELGPCAQRLGPRVRCGTLEVPENRAAPDGRHIRLSVMVVSAAGPHRAADALTLLAGGPGQPATLSAAGAMQMLGEVLESRDLLLVDQRGTGGSAPLECQLYGPPADLKSALGDFFPPAAVERCRATLSKQADLGQYTTTAAAADLDEVRAALGYEQLTVVGGSYGTRAALEYLRRYPSRVRAAVLQGVLPPGEPLPRGLPVFSQHALDGVVGECAADPACKKAFPRLAEDVRSMFAKLESPARVEVLNPATAELTPVVLSRDLAAEAVRFLLYQASSASSLPAVVHAAATGDLGPLAEFAVFARQQIVATGAMGMYLSVVCAEDRPFVDAAEAERLARGTFVGDYRFRQQRAACERWVRGAIPPDFHSPVHAAAPVLLVSGQWDPATPPELAAEAARGLEHAVSIVVPSGGHEYDGLAGAECVDALVGRFIAQGSAEGLDTSCVAKVHRAGFVTELPPTKIVALPPAELAALAGRWVAEGRPFEVTLEVVGRALRLVRGNDPPILLAPVSPTRFRVAGAQGMAAVFDRASRPGPRMTLEAGGKPLITLVRAPSNTAAAP